MRQGRTCSRWFGSRNCWLRNRCRSSRLASVRTSLARVHRHVGRCSCGQSHRVGRCSCGHIRRHVRDLHGRHGAFRACRHEVHRNCCIPFGMSNSDCCTWDNPNLRGCVNCRVHRLCGRFCGRNHHAGRCFFDRSPHVGRSFGRNLRHPALMGRLRVVPRKGCTPCGMRSLSCCTWGSPSHRHGYRRVGHRVLDPDRWIGTGHGRRDGRHALDLCRWIGSGPFLGCRNRCGIGFLDGHGC